MFSLRELLINLPRTSFSLRSDPGEVVLLVIPGATQWRPGILCFEDVTDTNHASIELVSGRASVLLGLIEGKANSACEAGHGLFTSSQSFPEGDEARRQGLYGKKLIILFGIAGLKVKQ